MGAQLHKTGYCECKCPGDACNDSEAQVQLQSAFQGHTSYLRHATDGFDDRPIGIVTSHRFVSGDFGETLSSGQCIPKEHTGESDSASSSYSGMILPRRVFPSNPNKACPVPKLVIPEKVYEEPKGSKNARRVGPGQSSSLPDQAQFRHLAPLPKGWVRLHSKSTGSLYYRCPVTGETSFQHPGTAGQIATLQPGFECAPELPPGWHVTASRTTGRQYYWNSESNKSQFDHPSAPPRTQKDSDASRDLPPGWVKLHSRTTGRPYFFNSRLQLSQFKHPADSFAELEAKLQNEASMEDAQTKSQVAGGPQDSDQKTDQKPSDGASNDTTAATSS